MSNINKLTFSRGVPSFEIKRNNYCKYISEKSITELIGIIPEQIADKQNYFDAICEWFLDGIALPIIKEYLVKLINSNLKININNINNFNELKTLIEKK